MTEKIDYYKIGSREHIVISNSSLSAINPEQSGSPQAFLDFLDGNKGDEKEKSYLTFGTLIHKWAEDRKAFKVSEVNKPSDKLGEVADCALDALKKYIIKQEEEDANFNIIREEGFSYIDNDDYEQFILQACRVIGWNPKYGDDAIIKNAVPPIKPYLEEVQKATEEHKIYISAKEKEKLEKCVAAVEKHPVAKELLFLQDTEFSDKKVFSELEIYWDKGFKTGQTEGEEEGILVYFKAKLDKLIIDNEAKEILYADPKTSAHSPYAFIKSFETYHYYRQLAFYEWAIKEFCKQQNINIEGYTFKSYNIVIETANLFQVAVVKANVKWLFKGKQEYQDLVKRIVWHIQTNQWNYSKEEFENGMILEIPWKE